MPSRRGPAPRSWACCARHPGASPHHTHVTTATTTDTTTVHTSSSCLTIHPPTGAQQTQPPPPTTPSSTTATRITTATTTAQACPHLPTPSMHHRRGGAAEQRRQHYTYPHTAGGAEEGNGLGVRSDDGDGVRGRHEELLADHHVAVRIAVCARRTIGHTVSTSGLPPIARRQQWSRR